VKDEENSFSREGLAPVNMLSMKLKIYLIGQKIESN